MAAFYSKQHPSFHWIWSAALPAFSLEIAFYLGSVLESTRSWFGRLPRIFLKAHRPRATAPYDKGTGVSECRGRGPLCASSLKALLLWLSALVPFLIFTLAAGVFQRNAFYLLALLTALLAFWYVVLPRRIAYDIGFLVLAAAPFLTKIFERIYRTPDQHLRVDILGHLMWIRLGLIALLVFREWDPGPVGFWPTTREWRTGLLWFGVAIIPLVLTALALHDVRYEPQPGPWWRVGALAIGYFFGFLWVVSLAEELFFRGFIERALLNSRWSTPLAVAASSILYGTVHLWFHQFPNWRRAVVVTVLGVACGVCYVQTRSIRSSMVTHALTIVVWRILFK